MKENTNNKVQKIDFSSQTTKSQLPAKVHSKVISGQFSVSTDLFILK